MVIRGSNEPNPSGRIPAWEWKTVSCDHGHTWSPCEPFTFADGEPPLPPSSCLPRPSDRPRRRGPLVIVCWTANRWPQAGTIAPRGAGSGTAT